VDSGYFSVLLGEGRAVGSEAYPAISTIFRATDASDRFIGITVKDLNGTDAVIQPRLRLVTSPYSFLAKHAKGADTIVGSGGTILTTDGPNVGIGRTAPEATLDVDGTVRVRNTAQFDGVTSVGALSVGKTSAPTATLDVLGNAKISSGLDLTGVSYFRSGFNIMPNGGAAYHTSFWSDSYGSYIKNDSAARRMILGAGNRNAIWINPNGNVGIDVWWDPVYKFQVNGVASATGLRAAGGYIVPSFGNTAGIKWDENPAGGGGDYAHIYYMQDTAGVDDTSLNIMAYDDFEDDIRFWQYGGMRMQISGGAVYSHGNFYAPITYDLNDDKYYVDPNHASRFNQIFAAIMYDTDDPTYYTNPGLHSRMNVIQADSLQVLSGRKTAMFSRDDQSCYIGLDQSSYNTAWRFASYNGDSNWDFISDRRLKKDIVDAESVLDKVMNVQVRRFKFKEGSTNDEYNEIGVIAQELEDVFPDLVSTYKDPQTEVDYLAVGYTSFGVISVKAVQELKKEKDAEIQTLRSEIDELKAQINELKALIQN
jgi:hypothetical protein